MTEYFWLFLLLPLAAASGWLAGRRGGERKGGARVSRLVRTRMSAVTREIIDLAVRYNLVSRETSLVAFEKRDTPV